MTAFIDSELIRTYENRKFKAYLYFYKVSGFSYYKCEIINKAKSSRPTTGKKFNAEYSMEYINAWVVSEIGSCKVNAKKKKKTRSY